MCVSTYIYIYIYTHYVELPPAALRAAALRAGRKQNPKTTIKMIYKNNQRINKKKKNNNK